MKRHTTPLPFLSSSCRMSVGMNAVCNPSGEKIFRFLSPYSYQCALKGRQPHASGKRKTLGLGRMKCAFWRKGGCLHSWSSGVWTEFVMILCRVNVNTRSICWEASTLHYLSYKTLNIHVICILLVNDSDVCVSEVATWTITNSLTQNLKLSQISDYDVFCPFPVSYKSTTVPSENLCSIICNITGLIFSISLPRRRRRERRSIGWCDSTKSLLCCAVLMCDVWESHQQAIIKRQACWLAGERQKEREMPIIPKFLLLMTLLNVTYICNGGGEGKYSLWTSLLLPRSN